MTSSFTLQSHLFGRLHGAHCKKQMISSKGSENQLLSESKFLQITALSEESTMGNLALSSLREDTLKMKQKNGSPLPLNETSVPFEPGKNYCSYLLIPPNLLEPQNFLKENLEWKGFLLQPPKKNNFPNQHGFLCFRTRFHFKTKKHHQKITAPQAPRTSPRHTMRGQFRQGRRMDWTTKGVRRPVAHVIVHDDHDVGRVLNKKKFAATKRW